MKALYNKKLRSLADKTALRQVATPLFLCDEKLYICMKSIGAEKSIKQPITGSNLEVYMDESLKGQVLGMRGGWLYGTIYLNSAELETIIYTGTLEGEKYYVFLSEEGRLFHSYEQMPNSINASLQMLNDRIGGIINELLHSKTEDAGKLDRNCTHMIRLKRYISVALNESIDKNKYYSNKNENLLSVNVLLDCIFNLSNGILPAYGYHIQYDFHKAELRYCDCSTRSLITLICILLFNAISLSEDGVIKVAYTNRAAHRMLEIEMSTESKLGETVYNGGISELAGLLLGKNSYPFVLELMVSAEITKALGWKIGFSNADGEFVLKVELPESTVDISRIQLRANSIECDYAEMLIREFMVDLD